MKPWSFEQKVLSFSDHYDVCNKENKFDYTYVKIYCIKLYVGIIRKIIFMHMDT